MSIWKLLSAGIILVAIMTRTCEGIWCYQCLQTVSSSARIGWKLTADNAGSSCEASGPNHRYNVTCDRFNGTFKRCIEMAGKVFIRYKGGPKEGETIPLFAKGCSDDTRTGCSKDKKVFENILNKYIDYETFKEENKTISGEVCWCDKNWCNTKLTAGRFTMNSSLLIAMTWLLYVLEKLVLDTRNVRALNKC